MAVFSPGLIRFQSSNIQLDLSKTVFGFFLWEELYYLVCNKILNNKRLLKLLIQTQECTKALAFALLVSSTGSEPCKELGVPLEHHRFDPKPTSNIK